MEDNRHVEPTGVEAPRQRHAEAATEDLAELREKRTNDYLREVLDTSDPLSANVGAVNADLMLYANHMRRIIAPALERLPAEPKSLANLVPAMESHSRLARQIERLAGLLERLNRAQAAAKRSATEAMTNETDKPAGH